MPRWDPHRRRRKRRRRPSSREASRSSTNKPSGSVHPKVANIAIPRYGRPPPTASTAATGSASSDLCISAAIPGRFFNIRSGNTLERTTNDEKYDEKGKRKEWYSAILWGGEAGARTNVKGAFTILPSERRKKICGARTTECITAVIRSTWLSVAALFAAPRPRSKSEAFHWRA